MRAAILVLLLSGCGASGLVVANGVALGAQTSALACDWRGTREMAEDRWMRADGAVMFEANPIMGRKPTPEAVDAYFLAALSLATLGWYLAPRRYRLLVPAAVLAIQVKALADGLHNHIGLCGL